ncbi:uncharacterized protein KY384_004147 [Bacidia gigantensis]|uniref:uncharacterized protein n=1 Tax=Bacidia gigantensis TaxID=2732470 RepID=UPI001D0417ED|nr:uncharacterized protein KY384_004147 [Bacidia gigantensis]KAG8530790.1 hypothetical protein KY384_004147 [Bacidia gigantensis]
MESINVSELVERLGSDEDPVRKMAVFKLQTSIADPSFADVFILEGGLSKLRYLVLNTTGNTLAYSLTSFSRLLEVDKGWDCIDQDVVERMVELVVTHPLVNILRGAMSNLASIVSHPSAATDQLSQSDTFGFRALKPAIAIYPQFLERLVTRLSAADHALCGNALQLINSLMREAITNDTESDWPKLIRRLQDLGVIEAVYGLMQSTALQDLSQPLLEYQTLTKVLLRKWRDVPIILEKPEHRRALKSIHAASKTERPATPVDSGDEDPKKKPNPEKWRRLGFETENPALDFEETGYLGMIDLTEYVNKYHDTFQRQIAEQSSSSTAHKCPLARVSLAVTAILLETFEVDKADVDDAKFQLAYDSKQNFDKIFRPLLLQWSVLHNAGLQAFFRLWRTTDAETEDFFKIFDLVRILFESVAGTATRTKDLKDVQREIAEYELSKLRETQMQIMELTYEGNWRRQLSQIKDELSHEALQFVKEQRIRCLLAGAWFPINSKPDESSNGATSHTNTFRYAKLSHNRRYLHYSDFDMRGEADPSLEGLSEKIDLSAVTSVTSNVSASRGPSARSSVETLKTSQQRPATNTRISIHGHASGSGPNPTSQSDSRNGSRLGHTHQRKHSHQQKETTLLILHPQTQALASEWLDGLLMLLNQQPITNDTSKLINMIRDYGLKIRLLNVRFDEMGMNGPGEGPEMPSREGLDEDFYYDDFGG